MSHMERNSKDETLLTKLLTINSARENDLLQAPPIRNDMSLPVMINDGEVRVPWGASP